MGRLAASIGFAFGSGVSAGITEKRRQDAADKRSKELRDAALNTIAIQQKNAEDNIRLKDQLQDENRALEIFNQTEANIPVMESMFPGSTKNISILPDKTFSEVVDFKNLELQREQKAITKEGKPPSFTPVQKEELKLVQTGIKETKKKIDVREKEIRKEAVDKASIALRTPKKTGGFLGFFQDEPAGETPEQFISRTIGADPTLTQLGRELETFTGRQDSLISLIQPESRGLLPTPIIPKNLNSMSIEELLQFGVSQ